jgi:hypothetical protein
MNPTVVRTAVERTPVLHKSEINGDSGGDKRAAISFELDGVSDVALCLMQGGRTDLGKLFLISALYAKFFK